MEKKRIRKFLALFLSLAMVLSAIPVASFADGDGSAKVTRDYTYGYNGDKGKDADYSSSYDGSSYKKDAFNYVAIGDSITAGFGLDDYIVDLDNSNKAEVNSNPFYNISKSPADSYPEKVGDVLEERGMESVNVKNLGIAAAKTRDISMLLDGATVAVAAETGNHYSYGAFYSMIDYTLVKLDENKVDAVFYDLYKDAEGVTAENKLTLNEKVNILQTGSYTAPAVEEVAPEADAVYVHKTAEDLLSATVTTAEAANTAFEALIKKYYQTYVIDNAAEYHALKSGTLKDDYLPYEKGTNGKTLHDEKGYVPGILPVMNVKGYRYLQTTRDYTDFYKDQLKDADLVTVAIGSNDLLGSVLGYIVGDDVSLDASMIEYLPQLLGDKNFDVTMLNKIISEFTDEQYLEMLGRLTGSSIKSALTSGYNIMTEEYPSAIEKIRKNCKNDVNITLLSGYHSFGLRAYAYFIASLIDKKELTKTELTAIDAIVNLAMEYASTMNIAQIELANTEYEELVSSLKERAQGQSELSDSLTDTLKDVQILIMPVVVAMLAPGAEQPMNMFSSYVQNYAEKNGYGFVSLKNIQSSGTLNPHPSPEANVEIAEAIADSVISVLDFSVEGKGTCTVDGKAVSKSVYANTGSVSTVVIKPETGYKLYSVKVNDKNQTPTYDSVKGEWRLSFKVTGDSTIKVKFVSGQDSSIGSSTLDPKGKYQKVVALGDSMTAGIGLEGFDTNLQNIINMVNSKISPKESYPQVLSQYFDATLLENYGSTALTVFGLYGALTDTTYNFNFLNGIDLSDTYYNVFSKYGEIIDADLITLQVGYSELLFGVVSEMIKIDGVSDALATDLVQSVIAGASLKDILTEFVTTMKNDAESVEAFKTSILSMLSILQESTLNEIFENSVVTINQYLPKVLDAIHQLNPNADIALIGYYNPYQLSRVSTIDVSKYSKLLSSTRDTLEFALDMDSILTMFDELDYPAAALLFGSTSEAAVKSANKYIKACAEGEDKVIFVDIEDIEKPVSLNPYPGTQGHIDIANKILEATINGITVTSEGGVTVVQPEGKSVTQLGGTVASETVTFPVKFSETLHLDLGYSSGNVVNSITVDGKSAEVVSNYYIPDNKKDRAVTIKYGTAGAVKEAYKLTYKYSTDVDSDISYWVNDLDEVAYKGVKFMMPEAPEGLCPTGKVFGGWKLNGKIYKAGDIVSISADSTIYAVWNDDPEKIKAEATYKLTVDGGVTVDGKSEYKAGEKVFIYAQDPEGRTFTGWKASKDDIFLVDSKAICTYFFMPSSDVKITAQWTGEGTKSTLPFTDVKRTDWSYNSIKYCYEKGIMKGTSKTLFEPKLETTRAMIVTMLHRLEGLPEADTKLAFLDVSADSYYCDAVKWAYKNGIVEGKSKTVFAPYEKITRQELAAILYRFAEYKKANMKFDSKLALFKDVNSISKYAVDALAWANYNGLILGVKDSVLDPNGYATREQVAAIFERFSKIFFS